MSFARFIPLLALFIPLSQPRAYAEEATAAAAIERALAAPITFDFHELTLPAALAEITKMTGVRFVIDREALREAGIRLDYAFSLHLIEVSLRTALKLLLAQAHLSFMIEEGHVRVAPRIPKRWFLTKAHPVGDLIRADCHWPLVLEDGGQLPTDFGSTEPISNVDRLVKFIMLTIEPRSWSDLGGPGTLRFVSRNNTLVVEHAPDIQEQVEELLKALRRLTIKTNYAEATIVKVSAQCLRELASKFPDLKFELKDGGTSNLFEARLKEALDFVATEPSSSAPRTFTLHSRSLKSRKILHAAEKWDDGSSVVLELRWRDEPGNYFPFTRTPDAVRVNVQGAFSEPRPAGFMGRFLPAAFNTSTFESDGILPVGNGIFVAQSTDGSRALLFITLKDCNEAPKHLHRADVIP